MSVGSVGGGNSGALGGGGQVSAHSYAEGVAFVVPHDDLSGSFSGLDSSGSLDPSGFVKPLPGRKIKNLLKAARARPEVTRRPGDESAFTTQEVAHSLFGGAEEEENPLSASAVFAADEAASEALNSIPETPASDSDISDNDDDLSDSDTSDDEPTPITLDSGQRDLQAMLARDAQRRAQHAAVLPLVVAKLKTKMSQPEFDKSLASYNRAIQSAKIIKIVGRVLFALGAIATALLLGSPWLLVGLGAALDAGTVAVSWIKGSTVLSPIAESSLGRAVNFVATSPLIKTLALVSGLVVGLGVCLWTGGALAESWYHDKINDLKQQNPKLCNPSFS